MSLGFTDRSGFHRSVWGVLKMKQTVAAVALVVMAVAASGTAAERKILGEYFTQPN